MDYITLDPQQSNAVARATGFVQARDSAGRIVGYFVPKLPPDPVEDLGELLRRRVSSQPCYTIEQVRDHLRALDAQ